MTTRLLFTLFAAAVLLALPTPASASNPSPAKGEAGLDEKIGAIVPGDLEFRDESDKPIALRDCFAGKTTILLPMYYRCPMLCNVVLKNLVDTLRTMPQDFSVGGPFNVVCVSIDPKEHSELAERKKESTLKEYGRTGAETGWRFLTGTKEAIAALTDTIGYRYEYDRTFKEYNHPSGLIILTPEGKIARYFYGVDYEGEFNVPGGTTTLRLSLVEASEGKIGSLKDKLTLLCYSFNPTGYSLNIKRAVQLGGIVTMLAMGFWLGLTLIRERRAAKAKPNPSKDGLSSGGST